MFLKQIVFCWQAAEEEVDPLERELEIMVEQEEDLTDKMVIHLTMVNLDLGAQVAHPAQQEIVHHRQTLILQEHWKAVLVE